MASYLSFLDVLFIFIGVYYVKNYLSSKNRLRIIPPGPRPLPVIGNLLDMPTSHEWLRFAEWGHSYGQYHSVTLETHAMALFNLRFN